MQLLIENGADINTRDESDSTPLHLASSVGSFDTVQLLIDHGADLDAKDNTGQTPYQVAQRLGEDPNHKAIAQLLSDHDHAN